MENTKRNPFYNFEWMVVLGIMIKIGGILVVCHCDQGRVQTSIGHFNSSPM